VVRAMSIETLHTVRPELVEGPSFLLAGNREGEGFDRLSPNGYVGIVHV